MLLLNILGLIQKALKLVKKVEDLGEKRKKIQETKRKSKSTDRTDIGSSARNSINIVDKISKKIEELKVSLKQGKSIIAVRQYVHPSMKIKYKMTIKHF